MFGGNPIAVPNPDTNCQYKTRGTGPLLFYPENSTLILDGFSTIHQPEFISREEQQYYKQSLIDIFGSFNLPDRTVLPEIYTIFNLTDTSVIFNNGSGELVRSCPAKVSVPWLLPTTVNLNVNPGDTVCWYWNDTDVGHTLTTNSSIVVLSGFGTGNSQLANGVASRCANVTSGTGSCSVTLPPNVCFKFTTLGTYFFNCAIHPTQMKATIVVGTQTTTGGPTTSATTTSTTAADGTDGGSAAALLNWIVNLYV